jgi:hypothetical protein
MAMWCAICMAQPIMGILSTSTLEMYLKGRGRKPLSVMMSKYEQWLGMYMTCARGGDGDQWQFVIRVSYS